MPIVIDARTATDHFPGIGRYVVSLATALQVVAPETDFAFLNNPSSTTRLALPDLPTHACSASPFSLSQQWTVPRQLQRLKATLYHSPYYLMPYLPGVPTVLTCYDLIPLIYPRYFTVAQRLIFRAAHLLAARAAGVILAISEATRSDLLRCLHLPPEKVMAVALAASARFSPSAGSEPLPEAGRGQGLPERYVLYLGSNKPHKNLVRLVDAWQQVSRLTFQASSFTLLIAGHWDPRYPEAKRRVEELEMRDRVLFLPNVPEAELPALYRGAALFVFPSLYEGFGLPVLEAMACGTPVVCSGTSSLPEVAGDAALLVNPLDVEELAGKMKQVLADEAVQQDLRHKGLAQAARFSWERTARATLSAYQQCTRKVQAVAGSSTHE